MRHSIDVRCGAVVVALLGAVAVGCQSETSVDSETRCVPGRQIVCSCPSSGATGYRVCTEQGEFGDCTCSGPRDVRPDDTRSERVDSSTNDETAGDTAPDPGDTETDTGLELTGKVECEPYEHPSDAIWVAPDPRGSEDGDGSKSDPWNIDKVNSAAQSGDHFVFKDGNYGSVIQVTSGSAGDPTTYRAANRHGATVSIQSGNAPAFKIEGDEHVRVEGFVLGANGDGKWVLVWKQSRHIELRDLWMQGHTNDRDFDPLWIEDSFYVEVLDSVARESTADDMVKLDNTEHAKLAGNAFGLSPDAAVWANGSQYVVFRGNVFHNSGGRPAYIGHQNEQLVEDNLFTNGVDGTKSPRASVRVSGKKTIFRFNRVFRMWGQSLRTRFESDRRDALHVRAYHNVIDWSVDRGSGEAEGWSIENGPGTLRDVEIQNNIFARQGTNGGPGLFVHGDGWGEDGPVTFENNVFWGDDGSGVTFRIDGTDYGVGEADSQLGTAFESNRHVDPDFTDPGKFEHTTNAGSPAVDAAVPLAKTTASGSGKTLPVDDIYAFYDGFAIEDDRDGDVIAVGSPPETARVVDRNYGDGTLQLDDSISWNEGDPVQFPWSGDAPDIGRWERGDSGRRSVRIDQSAYLVQPGEPVVFRPEISGDLEVESFEWRLGEKRNGVGVRTCGRSFRHAYKNEGDYPVRLRVEAVDGSIHRATAHVMVVPEGEPSDHRYNENRMRGLFCTSGTDSLQYSDGQGYSCD